MQKKYPYEAFPLHLDPNLDRDYDSGALIRIASSNELPVGVLGIYNPSSHTITIHPNLSSKEDRFVRAHESGHARGLIDEAKTDAYAAGIAGYNLRPFMTSNSLRKAA